MRSMISAPHNALGGSEQLKRVIPDIWESVEGETKDTKRESG